MAKSFERSILLACAVLLTVNVSAPAEQAERFVAVPSEQLTNFNGVWRSRGYGWIWSIANGRVTTYDESGLYCISTGALNDHTSVIGGTLYLNGSQTVMQVPSGKIGYVITWDKLRDLPQTCRTPVGSDPLSVFWALGQVFRQHYAFFERRDVHWQRLMRSHREKVRAKMTEQELFDLLREILGHLNDGHVSLKATMGGKVVSHSVDVPKRGEDWLKEYSTEQWPGYWHSGALGLLVKQAGRSASGSITFGFIEPGIGLLQITSLCSSKNEDLEQTMERAINLLQTAQALIVDVSRNEGGCDSVGRRVAGRFAREKVIGLYKFAGDGDGEEPQEIYVEPSNGKQYLGPVFVLTSAETYSAAETFAMYMSSLPNITHIGEPTAGILSDILSKVLPNGWEVDLSNEVYLDLQGRSWEAQGVPPSIHLQVRHGTNVSEADIKSVRDAIAMIRLRTGAHVTKN